MDGKEEDSTREKLFEEIKEAITEGMPKESVVLEVEILFNIQACQRSGTEIMTRFLKSFKSSIDKYVNQAGGLSGFYDR